jgi:hypothetical protein
MVELGMALYLPADLYALIRIILPMGWYHNLVTQRVTQLLLSAMMDMSWLDLCFLPAGMMGPGITVLPPVCKPLCPDASNPANGVVSQSGNSEGDTATFACNDGYELVGAPVLTC